MYTYNAHVLSVYDGDTITVDIDLGLYVTLKNEKIRLFGINAPEIKGVTNAQGVISRDALRQQILGKDIIIETIKDQKEKFGRWLGILTFNEININDWMIANGYAVAYNP